MNLMIYFILLFSVAVSTEIKSQWIEQTLPGNIDVALGIDFINQDQGVLGGWHFSGSPDITGNAYYTTNSGTNWIEAAYPDSMRVIVEVQLINNMLGYGAGAYNLSGTLSSPGQNKSTNINQSIKKYSEQIGMNFTRQEFYRGFFVETTDGGLNWHPKGLLDSSVYYLVGIYFIDQQNGFVIASSQGADSYGLLQTSDGGNNWNFVIPFQPGLYVRDIRYIEQIGYLVYENTVNHTVFAQKTTDAGITWSAPVQLPLSAANKITLANSGTIFISGANLQPESSIIRSTDGGNAWQEIRTYNFPDLVYGVEALKNSDILLAYGTYFNQSFPFIDISLDGGNNWSYFQFTQHENHFPLQSKMVDGSRWYITGTNNAQAGLVWFTDNSGGVPVELISFTAAYNLNKVELNWSTASELNNFGFEIERSTNNNDWILIGFKEGKGTTTETNYYSFTDRNLTAGKYYYRLRQVDFDGSFEYSPTVEVDIIANEFALMQNYPNPFNPGTSIQYAVGSTQFVTMKVYDILGNEVAVLVNEEKPAGSYKVIFSAGSFGDASSLSSGTYFYVLQAGSFFETRKMTLIK
jgi:hypothetical protein